MMFVERRRGSDFEFEDRGVVLERRSQLFNMLVIDVEGLADEQSNGIGVGLLVGGEEKLVENQFEEEFFGNDLLVVCSEFVEKIFQMANTVGT